MTSVVVMLMPHLSIELKAWAPGMLGFSLSSRGGPCFILPTKQYLELWHEIVPKMVPHT